jgi:hypothetical protein
LPLGGFLPFAAVQREFHDWQNGDVSPAINHLQVMAAHVLEGRVRPFGGRH